MAGLAIFADGEWVKVIVPVAFFVIWALQQVAAGRQKAAGAAPRAPRPQKPRQDAAEALRRQIETYLAETDEAARKNPDAAAPAAGPRRTRRGAGSPEQQKRQSAADSRQPREEHPRREPVKASFAKSEASASAPEPLEPESFASSIAAHVEDVFDHEVGSLPSSRLKDTSDDQAAGEAKEHLTAAQLAQPDRIIDVIRNPRQMRNAIILSTILERPRR